MAESIRWDWLERHRDDLVRLTLEHVQLTVVSVGIAVAIAIPVGIAVRNRPIPFLAAGLIADVLYTIPSIALFAFLLPFTGIGATPAIVGLVAYALTMLIRNTVVGLRAVPRPVRDAALGMGLTARQTLVRVELPLALPAIFAGIRLATVSTVGIATIAAFVDGGGLGELILNDGIQRQMFLTPILAGTVIATVLALTLDAVLIVVERRLTPWTRARGAT
ncbi:MAG: ABC transporter permease [Actinobacteria bacterium]|nr:ABC transporter permease [Thermoleophilia bacterium]MCB9011818.1 ABC transporter permease [Actinomycetota bacterium]